MKRYTNLGIHFADIRMVNWRHRNLWSQYDLYAVGQHGVLCEDLSHYSNKIESVGLRKRPYCYYFTKESDTTITDISHSKPHVMAGKQPT